MQNNDIQLLKKREHCPSCHDTKSMPLYSESFSSEAIKKYFDMHYHGRALRNFDDYSYELVQCTNCNLAYQLYVPTDDLLSEIYDVWIPNSAREELQGAPLDLDYYRYLSEQIQFIIQYFQLPPDSINVLDFGFGWAEWSKMAMGYGCNVVGTELSQERVEYAQSIGLKVITPEELQPQHFHYINTEQVFEHVLEPRNLLARLMNSLQIGGVIKISVPNSNSSLRKIKKRNFYSLSRNEIMPLAPLEHVNCFTYKSLAALANSVGLKPLHPSFHKLYNSSSGWLSIKNAARLVARPIYRHVFPKSTFLYFVRA